jgi:O-antigen/teichoic acid export membrane protein
MSIETKALKGMSWLALFKFSGQLYSWVITILVARILVPGDYGLMAMATVITGYTELFSELGLGAAIIQQKTVLRSELSSVFWFSLAISLLFALTCFGLSYPTSYVFNEPRIIPITKTASVLFIITGLQIVPLNLLKKDLDFKKVGAIEMISVFVSCSSMFLIARLGGGVWTLIGGRIILNFVKMILFFLSSRWRPLWHFSFEEAKRYITFGIVVAIGGSLHYLFDKSDRFFAGRAWTPHVLGYYTFAMQLSLIPTEKIVTLINQVSFSTFSKLQDTTEQFINMYLLMIKLIASIILPLFVCGFLLGEDLVSVFLGDKWLPIVFIFRFLCLVQIITALNAINNFVHTAQGRPQWRLYFYAILAVIMPISFYFAVKKGFHAILIPWFSTYFIICAGWVYLTIRKIGIGFVVYLTNLLTPFIATIIMSLSIILSAQFLQYVADSPISLLHSLIIKMAMAALLYCISFYTLDRKFLANVKLLLKA